MKAYCTLALAALLLAGCHRDRDDATTDDNTTAAADAAATADTTMPAEPTPSSMPPADATAPSAADAVPVVMAIDQHEIDAAQLAKDKATRQDVKDYAAMLETEHRANLAQAQALPGATADSAAVAAMRDKGQQEMAMLQGAADFDSAYLDAMVNGHADALDKLDSTFIPGATGATVRDFLTNTRGAVSMHLDKARALQGAAAKP
jgi:putative membrane protein